MRATIQDVIDELRSGVAPIDNSVDVLIGASDPDTPVTGIATMFMPTQQAIEHALSLGVNLIVAHENPYFSHRTDVSLLAGDPVYAAKKRLIQQSGIAIYRHHDYCHRVQPDPIMTGLLHSLGWETNVEEMLPTAAVVTVPDMPASKVAEHAKSRLSIPYVRLTGDPDMTVRRIGLLVGFRGSGANAIPLFKERAVDMVIAGEGFEWETPEYVRDAAKQGLARALLMLGHAESEEPGMRVVAQQLRLKFPELPVHFIPVEPVFQVY
ncbi:putative NIF3 family GTP cyclohydrolase 1 type 2 [Paenibacillus phyllosphaerae]|uniref:GTP cyclohydrolase 1 type 2 homolog n=1 Tax=Paenibacillus phyllosphaerae TaxID=274593 RepID=A0A7W5B1R2_9BACL|nr:Nif3-like dinuclear metal center hexameric protein [Paenibacillus phyllosphaerae]MBB3112850.1 putative NIF3 family GTP cyclohydrolase 1 type 2 [Paenibacillus phyllosphaerae]